MRIKQLGDYTYPALLAGLVAFNGLASGASGLVLFFAFLAVMYWLQQRWALWVGVLAALYMILFSAAVYSLSDAELEHLKLAECTSRQVVLSIIGYVIVVIALVSTLLVTRKSKPLVDA